MAIICIIDDQQKYLDIMEECIMNHYHDCEIIKLTSFSMSDIQDKIIDLFILDIDMQGINGIDLGVLLRNAYPFVDIVFVSAHNNLVHNSLLVRPVYFIRKDHIEEDCLVLFKLLDFRKYSKKITLIDVDKAQRCFQLNSIAYVEILSHELTVHLDHHSYHFSLTLKDFLKLMDSKDIVQIHKSYLVNIHKIDYIKGGWCYLSDKDKLPIGRKYREKFLELYRREL